MRSPFGIRQHVIISEADDTIVARLEPARTRLTVIRMRPPSTSTMSFASAQKKSTT